MPKPSRKAYGLSKSESSPPKPCQNREVVGDKLTRTACRSVGRGAPLEVVGPRIDTQSAAVRTVSEGRGIPPQQKETSVTCGASLTACWLLDCWGERTDANRCYAMPCHAMPCHAMLCYAMPCHAMPCYAMPCHAWPCHAMLCYAMLCSGRAPPPSTAPVALRAFKRRAEHFTAMKEQKLQISRRRFTDSQICSHF